jgi:hypothetical protein
MHARARVQLRTHARTPHNPPTMVKRQCTRKSPLLSMDVIGVIMDHKADIEAYEAHRRKMHWVTLCINRLPHAKAEAKAEVTWARLSVFGLVDTVSDWAYEVAEAADPPVCLPTRYGFKLRRADHRIVGITLRLKRRCNHRHLERV